MSQAKQSESEFLQKIHKHQGILHKVCLVYSKTQEDRKDLYQEITLQLWKSYSSFKSESAFSTWMYRVALNTALNMTRKPQLFLESEKSNDLMDDIEYSMDLSEDIKMLYQAISLLGKAEKAIILLWLEEQSYEEIAETVGITVKNVSVKLVRIKAKLASIIKKLQ